MSQDTFTIELNMSRDRFINLGCRAIHRAQRARDAMHANNPTEAVAQYFAMDAEILPRAVKALPQDLKDDLLAAVAATMNEGK